MMNLKLITNVIGTLFPVIFPKQEFKPNRLIGVVIVTILVVGSVKLLGVEDTAESIELVEEVMDITEE